MKRFDCVFSSFTAAFFALFFVFSVAFELSAAETVSTAPSSDSNGKNDAETSADPISRQIEEDDAKIQKLANFLREERFPYRFLQTEAILGDKTSVQIKDGEVVLPVLVKLEADSTAFYEFVKKFEPFVDNLTIRKTRSKQQTRLLDPSPKKNAYAVELTQPSFDKRCAYVLLPASKKASKFETIHWVIRAVPIKTAIVLRPYVNLVPVLKLTFKDKNNKTVATKTVSTFKVSPMFAPSNGYRFLRPNFCFDINKKTFGYAVGNFPANVPPESHFLTGTPVREEAFVFSFLPVVLGTRSFTGMGDQYNVLFKEANFIAQIVFNLDDYKKIATVECRVVEKNSALDQFYQNIERRLNEARDFYRE